MNKAAKPWPKAQYVMRPDGSPLTLGDLPCAKTKRWLIGRKADVVDAVHGGLLSVEDACRGYSRTLEEFVTWRTAVHRWPSRGLERNASAKTAERRKSAPALEAE